MKWISLLLFFSVSAFANQQNIKFEESYLKMGAAIYQNEWSKVLDTNRWQTRSFSHIKLLQDRLWDDFENGEGLSGPERDSLFPYIKTEKMTDMEKARHLILLKKHRIWSQKADQILSELMAKGKAGAIGDGALFYLLTYRKYLGINIRELNPTHLALRTYADAQSFSRKSNAELQAIIKTNIPGNYRSGRYVGGVQVFKFCRHDRRYHCLMMMKDKNGNFITENGKLWSRPTLGLAKQGKRYNERNGYTPSGVYTMDGVMPNADRQSVFGQYRRVILNFIPGSTGERNLKSMLPEASHQSSWWKESVVARDMGRNLLRIHGTGLRNFNPFAKHYPFVKTSGCISIREGNYDRQYRDQREILDSMMSGMGLNPEYRNESKIRGLLYVIEVDDEKGHVTLDEMKSRLELNL